MGFISSTVYLLAALQLVTSIPLIPKESTDSVELLGRGSLSKDNSTLEHGPSEYLSGLIKYGINPTHPGALPIHEIITPDRRLRRRDVTLGLDPASLVPGGRSYKSPITIGTGHNAKTFMLVFDTGSPDLWVFSDLIDQRLPVEHVLYEPDKSTSAIGTHGRWNISYLDATSAAGVAYNDTVEIAGIIIPQQAVEAAVQLSKDMLAFEADGILGLSLAPNTIVPGYAPTTVENLFLSANSQITQKLFTVALTRGNEPEGFYTFGYIDKDLVGSSEIKYTTVYYEHGSWEVPSEYAVINGKRVSRQTGNRAIMDTGTTLIYVSDELLPLIYEPMGGHYDTDVQGWVFPANTTVSEVPSVVLPVGEHELTLDVLDIMRLPVDDNWIYGSIQSRGDLDTDLFGDYWLRNVYAVYDVKGDKNGPRFGFVPRAPIKTQS